MGVSFSYQTTEVNEEGVDQNGNKYSRSAKQSRCEAKVNGVDAVSSWFFGNTKVELT